MAKKPTKKRQKRASAATRGKTSGLSFSEYRITFGPTVDRQIPRQLRDQIEEIFPLIQDDPRQAVARLENLKELYPRVSLVSNHLIAAHGRLGNKEICRELIERNYRENPDYLFSKINYAQMCLQADQPEKIPEIFEEKYDLKLLYPRRNEFHVTEFSGFAGVMSVYFSIIGQKDAAKMYYDTLLQVVPDSEITAFARRFIKPSLVDKLRFWLRARLIENEKKINQAKDSKNNKRRSREDDTNFTA